jgi:t-SNARE complex subunit (syntaxin)
LERSWALAKAKVAATARTVVWKRIFAFGFVVGVVVVEVAVVVKLLMIDLNTRH